MQQKIFVNRILNMKKIRFIGLDMDHTLVRYNTKNFETLVYKTIVEKLITTHNYPQDIRKFKFTFDDAIRGLIVDSKNGNILKLSRYSAIRASYHGTHLINYAEQNKFYRSVYIDLKDHNYMAIDTSFSIAFCVLYAQLVDYKDEFPDSQLPSYAEIAQDVLNCVDKSHSDGSLKNHISQHLEDYVLKEPSVIEGLKKFIRHGKKFFILTNSDYQYCKLLLDFTINPYMDEGKTWKDLFEFVITLASKPRFFYDNLKFLSVNPIDGSMHNTSGIITPGIYQSGCARRFTENLGLSGDEILYIGDHIYGDILRLKKDCNWRTALVVEELGNEIASQKKALSIEKKIGAAMKIKMQLEQQYVDAHTQSINSHSHHLNENIRVRQQEIAEIDSKISNLLKNQDAFYNPHWGRVFRAGAEESYFAYQVERYACVYMEKLDDLLNHSPITYFRANRRQLPHDFIATVRDESVDQGDE